MSLLAQLVAPIAAPLRRRRRNQPVIDALYGEIMEAARRPGFYADLGVPDTVEGRYDMVVLHAYLVFARLRGTGAAGQALAQDLFDHMFREMDHALRELGVGDMGIGKRIQKMASQFYGRAAAYDRGLAAAGPELADAVARNAYAGIEPPAHGPAAIAAYMRRASTALASQPVADVLAGRITFPPLETP